MSTDPSGARGRERRRAPRTPAKIALRYRCVQDRLEHVGTIVNLSASGAALRVRKDLTPGSVLEFALPEGGRRQARVVWMRGDREEAGTYTLGLSFERIAAAPPNDSPAAVAPDPMKILPDCGPEGRPWKEKVFVKYRCVTAGVYSDIDYRAGVLLELRSNGLIMTSLRDYPPGQLLELQLPDNPLCKGRTIGGRTIWSRPQDKPGYHRIACVFVKRPTFNVPP